MKKNIIIAICALLCACTPRYAQVKDGQFYLPGSMKPTCYVGTNFWYGAILASTGQGGNRERLSRELDAMQALGITNLRVLVGADGERGVEAKVEPTLQTAPGVYNDTLLDGLDYLLYELEQRHMYAVLFLNNAWEWSGGYSQYLGWALDTHWPTPQEIGYPAYMDTCAAWSRCGEAQELFYDHIRAIVSRTNRYTGRPYSESPAIFSWQIANEPRAFSMTVADEFAEWIGTSARLIKSLDANHMISTGSEGIWGCENNAELCERIHTFPEIDYITCHIWPYNWGWTREGECWADSVEQYIAAHVVIRDSLCKPLVIEEFGFPRDGMAYALGTPTTGRDSLYSLIFSHVGQDVAGCNFWGWGGEAIPEHESWQPGDDYTGDPAQEAQGLNSVFLSDRQTLELIPHF